MTEDIPQKFIGLLCHKRVCTPPHTNPVISVTYSVTYCMTLGKLLNLSGLQLPYQ